MALRTNGYRLGFSPFKYLGGALVSIYTPARTPAASGMAGAIRGIRFLTDAQTALPQGGQSPGCWMLPQKAGGMAMRHVGSGSLAATLVPTRPMSIDLTGSGSFVATAALVVSMAAALSGSGSMSASISGRLNASINLSGSGGLSAAMNGVASMLVDMLGEGDLDSTISAIGDMSIDIVVTGTGLSTANVGQAVWSSLQGAINVPGTAGAALLAAGSAGDPWSTALPGSYPAGTAGAIMGSYLADIWRRLGLGDPQTTSKAGTVTTITDGTLVLTITEQADGSVLVERA